VPNAWKKPGPRRYERQSQHHADIPSARRAGNNSLIQERVVAMMSGFFGGLALLLAGLGLYGVTSYSVNRRRTELGIRLALGAAPGGVVRLVLAVSQILSPLA